MAAMPRSPGSFLIGRNGMVRDFQSCFSATLEKCLPRWAALRNNRAGGKETGYKRSFQKTLESQVFSKHPKNQQCPLWGTILEFLRSPHAGTTVEEIWSYTNGPRQEADQALASNRPVSDFHFSRRPVKMP